MSHHLIISSTCHTRSNLERGPEVVREAALLLFLVPPTHPPAFQQRLTSQNLITLLTCPICSVAGREGFNYICFRYVGKPWFPISQGFNTAPVGLRVLPEPKWWIRVRLWVPEHPIFPPSAPTNTHTSTDNGRAAAREGSTLRRKTIRLS